MRHQNHEKVAVWQRLFGDQIIVIFNEIVDMLEENKLLEPEEQMSDWKRLCLVLILKVDGVVVCSNKYGRITHEYVEMLDDINFFLAYPWGRIAFNDTISRFGPPPSSTTPLQDLKSWLHQQTSACYGFPLAFQIQLFDTIPQLLSKILNHLDLRNFTEQAYQGLSSVVLIHYEDVMKTELEIEVFCEPFSYSSFFKYFISQN